MRIVFHKTFKKHYAKLSPKLKGKVGEAISLFSLNPTDPSLRNHPLKGQMQGKRAFSVAGDVRIIFKEKDGYLIVLMLDVGSHAQVYGM